MSSTRQQAAELYHQLYLEIQEIKAGIRYELATSFCDNCLHRNWAEYEPQSYSEMYFGIDIADSCCHEDPEYWRADTEYIDLCKKLMVDLKTLAGDEERAAAQSRVRKNDLSAQPL